MSDLPPPVAVDLHEPAVRDYWRSRASQHTDDSYFGVTMSKFPEDLRVYEHLLWVAKPDVVIELGVQHGGGTLWLRDRLDAIARRTRRPGHVIGVELDAAAARANLERVDPRSRGVTLIEGDVTDPELPARVREHVPRDARVLVIEDTAHTYETTRAALEGFAAFVSPGGYLVVEDGCVDDDELRLDHWPRGVIGALEDWLDTPGGADFRVRRDLELYGVTCHPSGFLQRAGDPPPLAQPTLAQRLRARLGRR